MIAIDYPFAEKIDKTCGECNEKTGTKKQEATAKTRVILSKRGSAYPSEKPVTDAIISSCNTCERERTPFAKISFLDSCIWRVGYPATIIPSS